jgi:hypothetical protein
MNKELIKYRINSETSNCLFKGIKDKLIEEDVYKYDVNYMHLLIIKDIVELKAEVQILLECYELNTIQQSLREIFSILRRNVLSKAHQSELIEKEEFIIEKVEFERFLQQVCQG